MKQQKEENKLKVLIWLAQKLRLKLFLLLAIDAEYANKTIKRKLLLDFVEIIFQWRRIPAFAVPFVLVSEAEFASLKQPSATIFIS